MLLRDLLRYVEAPALPAAVLDAEVTGIQEDSRKIRPGNLFVARVGTNVDGARFLLEAQDRGAIAAVTSATIAGSPLPHVVLHDPAAAASVLTHAFHGRPTDAVQTLAVTGTNGKTTTTYLLRHVLNKHKLRCGLVGTVEIDTGASVHEATMTTPGAVQLAELLASMRDRGCRAAALEVSSHALHQGRVAGVHFAGAAFTNLTGDHLDYHGTMENYAAAKAALFEMLPASAVAVVNADTPWSARMVRESHARVVRFGFGEGVEYRATDIAATAAGTRFTLHAPDGAVPVATPLIGRHNVENALAAAGLLGEVFGLTATQIAAGLSDAAGAPGRLQGVRAGQRFAVLVDYAHTDDALENVLTALRPLTRGKLRVLFGCGGDRDRTKRPRMAATAQRLADAIYVTSDNPRTEPPLAILDQISAGFVAGVDKPILVEVDRRRAIEKILADAGPQDVVLIAGKGHENYQIIGTTKHHFDDVEECVRVLASGPVAA